MDTTFNYTSEDTSVGKKTLDKYYKDIRRYPVLQPKEETDLVERAQNGDGQAFEKLVKSNLRFVIKIARQYRHYGIPLSDLISEGNIGLMKAIEQFKPDKGFRLITYAVWWIRQFILKAISGHSGMVNIPKNKYWQFRKIRKELNHFEQLHERKPEPHELKKLMDLSNDELEEFYSGLVSGGSHQSLYNEEGEEMEWKFETGNNFNTLTDKIQQESLNKELDLILSRLTGMEEQVVRLYFGFDDRAEYSLDEIAVQLGVPSSKVRRLRESAIRKLRMNDLNKSLREYLGS